MSSVVFIKAESRVPETNQARNKPLELFQEFKEMNVNQELLQQGLKLGRFGDLNTNKNTCWKSLWPWFLKWQTSCFVYHHDDLLLTFLTRSLNVLLLVQPHPTRS